MKTKILSTVIFSTLLFASMYSEARTASNAGNKPPGPNKRVAPAGTQNGKGATSVRRGLIQQRTRAARSGGKAGLGAMSGRTFGQPAAVGAGAVIRNGQPARDMGLARERGPIVAGKAPIVMARETRENGDLLREGRDMEPTLREGEVVQDVSVTRTNVAAGTNQSHKLSDAFKDLFSRDEVTVQTLAEVVNGANAYLKASVLKLNEQAQKGTHQFSVQLAGKLIAFVSGRSTVKNPTNQDPSARELLHDMANNAGEAVSWPRQPRSNFFAIVQKVLETRNTHPQGLAGAFRDAVRETFQLARDKVMEKFWEIRRECRA